LHCTPFANVGACTVCSDDIGLTSTFWHACPRFRFGFSGHARLCQSNIVDTLVTAHIEELEKWTVRSQDYGRLRTPCKTKWPMYGSMFALRMVCCDGRALRERLANLACTLHRSLLRVGCTPFVLVGAPEAASVGAQIVQAKQDERPQGRGLGGAQVLHDWACGKEEHNVS